MTDNDVVKFQELFEREVGQTLSPEESRDCAESLVEMIRLIYKPITKKDYVQCTKNPNAI